ncbi:cupin domain-containing protein [Nocardia sp. NBC_01329]|uniref:cupin domain-containing protein n=1 Tax=Nocardia sp. NBC_01329 TaxID=2903594 RepID=UPI002E101334|nr:cupin domain-containing protein [Nocardia sp. NBC_01329]
MPERVITFRNGHRVTVLDEGTDDTGPYLRLRHELPTPGRQAGPHWHPVLTEAWTVQQGRLAFRVDGQEIAAGPGETVRAAARTVHEFRSEVPDTVLDHEIRPPLRHLEMFTLWSALDRAGATTRSGAPRNPLALALLWELQDGYLAGIPAGIQRVIFGGLAAFARRTGYARRWIGPADPN